MKKKRLLALLLTVCLATTCMLSGTIAKYTTDADANDKATVGKWGVQLSIDGSLFGTTYYDKNSGNTPATSDEISVSVKSSSDDKIIAPGTKNDTGLTIHLTGTPEVKTRVTMVVEVQTIWARSAGNYYYINPTNDTEKIGYDTYFRWDDALKKYVEVDELIDGETYFKGSGIALTATPYYPINFAYSIEGGEKQGREWDYQHAYHNSVNDLLNKLFENFTTVKKDGNVSTDSLSHEGNAQIFEGVVELDAGETLDSLGLSDFNITWEWKINNEAGYDTLLGDLAEYGVDFPQGTLIFGGIPVLAEGGACGITPFFSIEIIVEQVD